MNNIVVKVTYRDSDFREAIVLANNKLSYTWLLFPCILIFIAGILYAGMTNGFSTKVIALFTIYLLILMWFIYRLYLLPLNQYKTITKSKQEYHYSFSMDLVFLRTEHRETKYEWSFFKKVIESRNLFLLYYEKNRFIILPKRCFDNSDIDSFVQLLENVHHLLYSKIL